MSGTALVTDSTACVPETFVREHGIYTVPLCLKIGDATYRDGVDVTVAEFYERLPNCSPLPTTSQPSAGDFIEVYQRCVKDGAEGIVSVHISSGISGTVNSARLAVEQMPGVPIEIIDTQSAAAAQFIAIEAAVRARARGASHAEITQAARRAVDAARIVFTVDTLEYLYKGGRIGGAAALVGSLLQFRPLLYFREGKIDALERVRKSSRALERMVEVMVGWLGTEQPIRAVVMHAACPDRAEALSACVRQHFQVSDLAVIPLSPVLGTHVGVGTVGMCCCPSAAMGIS